MRKLFARLRAAYHVLEAGETVEEAMDRVQIARAERKINDLRSICSEEVRLRCLAADSLKDAEDENKRLAALLQDPTAVHKAMLGGTIAVPSGWKYVDVPTDPKAELAASDAPIASFAEAIRVAADYVRAWAEPMDSRHEGGTKALLHEIAVGIADLEPDPETPPFGSTLAFQKTNRGFARAEFMDCYGSECSLQQSSAASENCVWLGVDRPFGEAQPIGVRMHLTQGQVRALLPALRLFAVTGDLPLPAATDAAEISPPAEKVS